MTVISAHHFSGLLLQEESSPLYESENKVALFKQQVRDSVRWDEEAAVERICLGDNNFILGFILEFGLLGVPRCYVKALEHYEYSSIFHSNLASMSRVVNIYRNGREGVCRDAEKDKKFTEMLNLQSQAVQKSSSSGLWAGKIFKTLTLTLFEREATFCLALMYRHGLGGVSPDFSLMFKYYSRSASLGLPEAQFNLAFYYEFLNDERTSLDEQELRLAAECMEQHSYFVSDQDKHEEVCMMKKFLAIHWYRQSAECSFPIAFRSLHAIYRDLRIFHLSVEYCWRGALLNDSECIFEVSKRLLYKSDIEGAEGERTINNRNSSREDRCWMKVLGIHSLNTEQLGFQFLSSAVSQATLGDGRKRLMMAHLANCHFNGLGTVQDRNAAFDLLTLIFSDFQQDPWNAFGSDEIVECGSLWRLWSDMKCKLNEFISIPSISRAA
jgi:TPR repeat protein